MSRPRVWTGSKWQDLRFCYEPGLFPTWRYPWVEHIQDTPAVYNFTSTNEGWQSNPDIAGNLFGWGSAEWSGQAGAQGAQVRGF